MGFSWSARRRMRCVLSVVGAAVVVSALAAASPSASGAGRAAGKLWPTFMDPAPSRTGQIAFMRNAANESIWVMKGDGTQARQILTGTDLHPRGWSPDGSRLMYARAGAVFVANADGTGVQQLPPTVSGDVAWSPDGTRIATMDMPTRTVYTIDATDGSDPQAVHPGPGPQFVPGWQPRGTGTQGEDG